jgi:hypothetical protein
MIFDSNYRRIRRKIGTGFNYTVVGIIFVANGILVFKCSEHHSLVFVLRQDLTM